MQGAASRVDVGLVDLSDGPRHAARETRADVGTTLSLESERQRADLRAVVGASFKRLEQALRSLEEYAKASSAPAAAALEQLRYRTYTLERAIDITADSLDRLADARLYVLVDGRESADALARCVDTLVAAGVDVIQLRDKRLADRDLLARAQVVRRQTRGTKTLFIMNDRPDLARLAGADGVHVGQEELKVKEAPRSSGRARWWGFRPTVWSRLAKRCSTEPTTLAWGRSFRRSPAVRPISGLGIVAGSERRDPLARFRHRRHLRRER